ncbi:MAG: rhomboid family intramembrane serine protease, partial [Dietzia sp.]|nr:rhomboid family intramembrane serine protease [Dietzia sp.]
LVGALGALVLVALPRRLPRRVGRGGREAVSWLGYLVLVAIVAAAAWYAADTMSPGFVLRG